MIGRTRGWLCVMILTAPTSHLMAQCPAHLPPEPVGVVQHASLTEISGIAASRKNPGVLWVHNDSGDTARLFALSVDGAWLGTWTLPGVTPVDAEDMTIGPGPTPGVDYLYLGDIGDNANFAAAVRVYRMVEPVVDLGAPPAEHAFDSVDTITLTYPDGPRDAETLMVDVNADLYIVSKRVTAQGRVYRAGFPQSTQTPMVMEFVASLPWGDSLGGGLLGATGGDIAADGGAVIIRRYAFANPQATLWLREPGEPLANVFSRPGCNVTLPADPQGEAIAFAPDCLAYYTVSEGANQPIFLTTVNLPGDLDQNGAVDLADLGALLAAYGVSPQGDIDGDADTDLADLGGLLAAYGQTCRALR